MGCVQFFMNKSLWLFSSPLVSKLEPQSTQFWLFTSWGIFVWFFKLFGRNETKGSCLDMWIVINTNKIAYKNSIGAQDGQKQDCVKITSAEEELITIWCDVVQGNVNFLFLIHIWYDLILHMYFWLSFQRISLTFYGYVLRVW